MWPLLIKLTNPPHFLIIIEDKVQEIALLPSRFIAPLGERTGQKICIKRAALLIDPLEGRVDIIIAERNLYRPLLRNCADNTDKNSTIGSLKP